MKPEVPEVAEDVQRWLARVMQAKHEDASGGRRVAVVSTLEAETE